MSSKVVMSVEEYLQTSFDGPDCDYVDGEIVERNMGDLPHGELQLNLGRLLLDFGGLRVVTEIRIQITPNRFRVADLAAWRAGEDIGKRIPTRPPFLVVEILSPEDRLVRLLDRVRDYLSIGVSSVWVIDPVEENAWAFTPDTPGGMPADVLVTADPPIRINLSEALRRG